MRELNTSLLIYDYFLLPTYTTTRRNSYLYCVSAWHTHVLYIEGLMRGLLFTAVNVQRSRINGSLHTRRPISVHLPVFVVETFQL